jgi:hypothetical protein
MWAYLLVACCAAVSIFDGQGENSWDALRDVFYTHHFSDGEAYKHKASLDRPPWSNWAPFYNDDQFYARIVGALQDFLQQSEEDLEKQPPVRRAILLRDLWPVFDARPHVRAAHANAPPGAGDVADKRHAELRKLVAQVMRRLELTEKEALELPDNYKAAVDEKLFAAAFNADSPAKPFLPVDLFDENGPWVAMARSSKTVGALHHLQTVEYRSIFVAFIRVSANRQETVDYLNETRRSRTPGPPGTQLALVRRMMLPTKSGRIVATPVTESVQFIVIDPPDDRRFKFVIDRADLLAGRPGLHAIDSNYRLDPYAFEAGGLFPHFPKYDADGEMLLLGKYLPSEMPQVASLGHCAACHGRTIGTNLFANTQASHIAFPTTSADQAEQIIAHKVSSAAWQEYQAVRE